MVAGDRSRYGLAMSALGAIALAVAAFLPWYRVIATVHSGVGTVAGGQLTVISARDALPDMRILLLVVAGLAMLDALLPLMRAGAPVPGGAGGSVTLLGAAGAACALYRILDPPGAAGSVVAMSVLEGPWLALLASLAMILGGMWPRRVGAGAPSGAPVHSVWRGASGWTPQR
jgi:hypothetical protein